MAVSKSEIVAALQKAYSMELETITNYLANSIHLDGVRAEAIKKALTADITGELAHATQIGHRLKQLGATVPGSLQLKMTQILGSAVKVVACCPLSVTSYVRSVTLIVKWCHTPWRKR